LESVPGTNQYLAMRLKFLAQANNGNQMRYPLHHAAPQDSRILILRMFMPC